MRLGVTVVKWPTSLRLARSAAEKYALERMVEMHRVWRLASKEDFLKKTEERPRT